MDLSQVRKCMPTWFFPAGKPLTEVALGRLSWRSSGPSDTSCALGPVRALSALLIPSAGHQLAASGLHAAQLAAEQPSAAPRTSLFFHMRYNLNSLKGFK